MGKYSNKGGDSGVYSYEIGNDYIKVFFLEIQKHTNTVIKEKQDKVMLII